MYRESASQKAVAQDCENLSLENICMVCLPGLRRETGKLLHAKGTAAAEGFKRTLLCAFTFMAVSKFHFFRSQQGNAFLSI